MARPRLYNPEAMDLRLNITSDSRPLFIPLDYLVVAQAHTPTMSLTPLFFLYTPHHVHLVNPGTFTLKIKPLVTTFTAIT